MLGWLSKQEHPLVNLKKARTLIAALPADDPFKALEEMSEWLESLLREKELRLDTRLDAYKLLDEASQLLLYKLRREYFAAISTNHIQEKRLWEAIYRFQKTIADAYISTIEGFRAGEKGINAVMKELPLLCCRAVHAMEIEFKWSQLHHGSLEGSVWKTLFRTIQFAELQGITRTEVTLYPGTPYKCSVEQLFLTILMLWSSAPDNLLPLQFEIAERITVHFSRHFMLKSPKEQPDFALTHSVDLAAGFGPMRINASKPANILTSRFFSPAKAWPLLRELAGEVSKGNMPSEIHLGGIYPTDIVLPVLRHLEMHWSPTPPSRESERVNKSIPLTAVRSFAAAMAVLAERNADTETWESTNISQGGYDALLPKDSPEWVKIGLLFILRSENKPDWELAIVRRLSRNPEKKWHVGIQKLGEKLTPILLRDTSSQHTLPAILVFFDEKKMEANLLVQQGNFFPRATFEFDHEGKTQQLVPIELLEEGTDFIQWRFRLPKKSA